MKKAITIIAVCCLVAMTSCDGGKDYRSNKLFRILADYVEEHPEIWKNHIALDKAELELVGIVLDSLQKDFSPIESLVFSKPYLSYMDDITQSVFISDHDGSVSPEALSKRIMDSHYSLDFLDHPTDGMYNGMYLAEIKCDTAIRTRDGVIKLTIESKSAIDGDMATKIDETANYQIKGVLHVPESYNKPDYHGLGFKNFHLRKSKSYDTLFFSLTLYVDSLTLIPCE